MNKQYCLKNPYWNETLNNQGTKNICSLCCEDYIKCGGKYDGKNRKS